MIPTIEWKDGRIRMLDQTKLPTEIVYVDCRDVETVAQGIRDLWIRGAPAIGIAAAMGVALGAREIRADSFDAFYEEVERIAFKLGATRPTAVNLFWALDRMKAYARARREDGIAQIKEGLVREAQAILEEDIAVNRKMGFTAPSFSGTATRSSRTATPARSRPEDTARPWASSGRPSRRGNGSASTPTRPGPFFKGRGSRRGSSCRTRSPLRSSRTTWRDG